jgi:hypothetical protein
VHRTLQGALLAAPLTRRQLKSVHIASGLIATALIGLSRDMASLISRWWQDEVKPGGEWGMLSWTAQLSSKNCPHHMPLWQ